MDLFSKVGKCRRSNMDIGSSLIYDSLEFLISREYA